MYCSDSVSAGEEHLYLEKYCSPTALVCAASRLHVHFTVELGSREVAVILGLTAYTFRTA